MLTYNSSQGPNSRCMIGAAPAVYLLVGNGMWETAHLLIGRFHRKNETAAASTVVVLVACLVLGQGVLSSRAYFYDWVGTPSLYAAADAEMAEAARVLNTQSSDADLVKLIPYSLSNGHYGFDYLYQGKAPAHVIHATMTHLPQQ